MVDAVVLNRSVGKIRVFLEAQIFLLQSTLNRTCDSNGTSFSLCAVDFTMRGGKMLLSSSYESP